MSQSFQMNKGFVCPQGFLVAEASCGIKAQGHDVGIIYSQVPSVTVMTYTQNQVKGSTVLFNRRSLKQAKKRSSLICVHSGYAHLFCGENEEEEVKKLALLLQSQFGVVENQVLICATGKVSCPLPVEAIQSQLQLLKENLSSTSCGSFGESLLTVDQTIKSWSVKKQIDGQEVTISLVAKGGCCVSPRLSTLLVFLVTDACVEETFLSQVLHKSVESSFNCLDVDGICSPNDTVILMANGEAQNRCIDRDHPQAEEFHSAVLHLCRAVSRDIVDDVPGSQKVVEIQVQSAQFPYQSKEIALHLAHSYSFRQELLSSQCSFNNLLSILGSSSCSFNSKMAKIKVCGETIYQRGIMYPVSDHLFLLLKNERYIDVYIDLNQGEEQALFWMTVGLDQGVSP